MKSFSKCHGGKISFGLHYFFFRIFVDSVAVLSLVKRDWPESRNFRNLSFVSDEYTYRNVFHLRKHKLMLMKQIIDAVPRNVKIVRLHEIERSPEMFIQVRFTEDGFFLPL